MNEAITSQCRLAAPGAFKSLTTERLCLLKADLADRTCLGMQDRSGGIGYGASGLASSSSSAAGPSSNHAGRRVTSQSSIASSTTGYSASTGGARTSYAANNAAGGSSHHGAGSSSGSRSNGGGHLESTSTKLLVATKQLLEGLTDWSQGKINEEQVSDIYVRLGNCFNAAVAAFAREGISMKYVKCCTTARLSADNVFYTEMSRTFLKFCD